MPRSLLILLVAVLFSACDSNDLEVGPLGDVLVSVGDVRTGDGSILSVTVQTVEEYPCLGYRIEADARTSGSGLEADFGAVLLPLGDVCATALGPAEWSAPLPTDGRDGYRIRLSSQGQTDEYRVRSGVAGFTLEPIEVSFSRPQER